MPVKLKLYLARKIIDSLKKKNPTFSALELKPLFSVSNNTESSIQMEISLTKMENFFGISNASEILRIEPDEIITKVTTVKDRANRKICFNINPNIFFKEVIDHGGAPDMHADQKNVVVEFSSPNIAKPFHAGHLRSTIIGNFVSNLNAYMNNKVTRINYLGDWGTQFGLIKVGVKELNLSENDIKQNPIQLLYESYVHANALASKNDEINKRAREEFLKLEKGSVEDVNSWQTYINFTISELKGIYDRLGVHFDEYNYESMYGAKQIKEVVDQMHKRKVVKVTHDGKTVANIQDRSVTVMKSDGSTLYITRDIAAAMDRFKKYEFHKMYYVVENGQNDHFNALKDILYQMDLPWAGRLKHVKFGRVRGMSTRKGNVVFLKDILDETKELMTQRQLNSPTTKVPITDTRTSDILGVSCVIINDLKQRRQKDYEFSWERALQVQGDGGIKLQYTHSRLCNLEKNSGGVAAKECNPEYLKEPVIMDLVKEMGKFNDVISRSEEQLEACILVTYLFHLCNHINKALKVLQVKNQTPEIAAQRLLLFNTSRTILRQGMLILGLKPLTEM
ncbi:probable arginine--tRNA ligase, mitochondrial [Onthophagus taurus]|uniref:probable arginine--tRNA ligase, mitochondrial n=1 Tax=Onthophagus taurus TaxID=166361 RepID=UPI000C20AF82|nr:probable arginine--tRNA ligase, mitochondrial [Onthophagus taurus]